MSISDDLMWRYFELLSFRSLGELAELRRQVDEGMNPRDAKFELGTELVARFHSGDQAGQALQNFVERFQKGAMPSDIPVCVVRSTKGCPLPMRLRMRGWSPVPPRGSG